MVGSHLFVFNLRASVGRAASSVTKKQNMILSLASIITIAGQRHSVRIPHESQARHSHRRSRFPAPYDELRSLLRVFLLDGAKLRRTLSS